MKLEDTEFFKRMHLREFHKLMVKTGAESLMKHFASELGRALTEAEIVECAAGARLVYDASFKTETTKRFHEV